MSREQAVAKALWDGLWKRRWSGFPKWSKEDNNHQISAAAELRLMEKAGERHA